MSKSTSAVGGVALLDHPSIRSPSLTQPEAQSTKRKRNNDSESAGPQKIAKRKKDKNAKAQDDQDLDVEAGVNMALGRMDSSLLADYIAQRTKRFEGDLSVVELEDKHVSSA